MNILLKNGHIIDPSTGRDEIADVLVVDGIIDRIRKGIKPTASTEVHDFKGIIVAPGFMDMHVHAREPGFEHKETLSTVIAAAAAGGFTAICCMPNTDPPIDDATVVEFIKRKAEEVTPRLVDVFPIGAVTKRREGKELAPMADLVDAGTVAFSDDGSPVASAGTMRRALEYASMVGRPIIQHAEDSSLVRGGVMNEGIVSTRLGLPGIPALAEEIMIARDIRIVEYLMEDTIARPGAILYHVAHISTSGAVEIVRKAKQKNLPVTCEVTPHHFTFTDELVQSFDTNTKMNPPLRTKADIEAIQEGLRDGTIDAIATDHAPHSYDEKQVEYVEAPFGIVGLETAVGLAMTELVKPKTLSLMQFVEKFSTNPRKILKVQAVSITEGQPANLTLIDPLREWTVDVSKFKSKSKNSPFHGKRLTGKPVAVINHGTIHFI